MERFVRYGQPGDLRAAAGPFLLAKEAENNLIIGLLGAIDDGRYREFMLGALYRDDEVAAVAIQTPPFPMVLSTGEQGAGASIAHLLEDLPDRVNGPVDQVRPFVEAAAERTGITPALHMAQRIYKLTQVQPPEGVPGGARIAGNRDRRLLREWLQAFQDEAIGDAVRVSSWDEQVTRRIEERSVLLWEDGGSPVCLAGFGGETPRGVRVGPVYTPPEHRRRGYAAACVAELSRRLLEQGRSYCFLYTDLANPTSNGVYQRIGYEPVCDVDIYSLRPEP